MLKNTAGYELSALSFDILYNADDFFTSDIVKKITFTPGPASEKTGKAVQYHEISPGRIRVGIFSPSNNNIIKEGIIAYVTVDLADTDNDIIDGNYNNLMLKFSASNPFGNKIRVNETTTSISTQQWGITPRFGTTGTELSIMSAHSDFGNLEGKVSLKAETDKCLRYIKDEDGDKDCEKYKRIKKKCKVLE